MKPESTLYPLAIHAHEHIGNHKACEAACIAALASGCETGREVLDWLNDGPRYASRAMAPQPDPRTGKVSKPTRDDNAYTSIVTTLDNLARKGDLECTGATRKVYALASPLALDTATATLASLAARARKGARRDARGRFVKAEVSR